ncbi:Fatty oxidation complex, alpha subunit FadB [Penicillium digitatum]|uniref:Fatty oxidation complex, alpha subunit FadB n=1 Tax=Penicillium digitatum TaxID=36651 RepID=A0A7T6XVH9_PENDI|nr:Fatty oxidation complex, alpha subunit FadB [Penicillium digitatum]
MIIPDFYSQRHPLRSIPSIVLEKCEDYRFSPFHVKRDFIGYVLSYPKEIDNLFEDTLKMFKSPLEYVDVVDLDVVVGIDNHYTETRNGVKDD